MEKIYPILEENSMNMWLIKYMHVIELELELELMLFRWIWERGEKGLQKQARVRALCDVVV